MKGLIVSENQALADELTSALRIGVEDDVTIPFELSVRILAALNTRATPPADVGGLDFHLEERGGVACIVEDQGGVRPANMHETAMWDALASLKRRVVELECELGINVERNAEIAAAAGEPIGVLKASVIESNATILSRNPDASPVSDGEAGK